MDNDFKTLYNTLRAEQDALKAKMQSAKGDAIKHVQELIDAFQIQSYDLKFEDTPSSFRETPVRRRGRTPTGIEWTGKGNMKREFRDYLLSQGLTVEDKDLFLTPEFQK